MKKFFKVEVDCALCAQKICDAVKKLPGIRDISINFMTEKMIIDFVDEVDYEKVLQLAMKTAKKVEPDFKIIK